MPNLCFLAQHCLKSSEPGFFPPLFFLNKHLVSSLFNSASNKEHITIVQNDLKMGQGVGREILLEI